MSYYNYKLDEVLAMNSWDYNMLVEGMYINEARNTLVNMEVVSYPKVKDDARRKIHKKYSKIANPQAFRAKSAVSMGDLARILNG